MLWLFCFLPNWHWIITRIPTFLPLFFHSSFCCGQLSLSRVFSCKHLQVPWACAKLWMAHMYWAWTKTPLGTGTFLCPKTKTTKSTWKWSSKSFWSGRRAWKNPRMLWITADILRYTTAYMCVYMCIYASYIFVSIFLCLQDLHALSYFSFVPSFSSYALQFHRANFMSFLILFFLWLLY